MIKIHVNLILDVAIYPKLSAPTVDHRFVWYYFRAVYPKRYILVSDHIFFQIMVFVCTIFLPNIWPPKVNFYLVSPIIKRLNHVYST